MNAAPFPAIRRQILPGRSHSQYPKHCVDKTTVILGESSSKVKDKEVNKAKILHSLLATALELDFPQGVQLHPLGGHSFLIADDGTAGDTTMIVSRGSGNSIIPVRFNNRPEIVIIELI